MCVCVCGGSDGGGGGVVVVELHATANYEKVLLVAQQCFYGKIVTGNNANYM
jgi:hypothetical protein